MFNRHLALFALLSILPIQSYGSDDSDGFSQVFSQVFGTQNVKEAQRSCGMLDNSQQGMIGSVNSLFCHLEKDLKLVSTTSGATKTLGNIVYKVTLAGAQGAGSFSGYDFELQLWVCKKQAIDACSSPTQFKKGADVDFSYANHGRINKGVVLEDPLAFEGSQGGALKIVYDLGYAAASTSFNSVYIRGTQKTATIASTQNSITKVGVVSILSASSAVRFAGSSESLTNKATAYFLPQPVTNTNASDTITFSSNNCFKRTRKSGDFSYSPSTGCSVASVVMPALSLNDLNGMSAASVLGTNWSAMLSQPGF